MSERSKKGFKALIRKLWQKEWVVYSKAPFGGPECPKCRKGHMAQILELPRPKIMPRHVRIVLIDSS